ncbi:unnamed protein product, partial [Prorocentrum cordatum]
MTAAGAMASPRLARRHGGAASFGLLAAGAALALLAGSPRQSVVEPLAAFTLAGKADAAGLRLFSAEDVGASRVAMRNSGRHHHRGGYQKGTGSRTMKRFKEPDEVLIYNNALARQNHKYEGLKKRHFLRRLQHKRWVAQSTLPRRFGYALKWLDNLGWGVIIDQEKKQQYKVYREDISEDACPFNHRTLQR